MDTPPFIFVQVVVIFGIIVSVIVECARDMRTMSRICLIYLCLNVWFVLLNCETYQDRPKIKTADGDLILEPAFNKNIFLRSNGPMSGIFVGDHDLLNSNSTTTNAQYIPPSDDLERYLNGPNGILQRIRRLETQNVVLPNDLTYNISLLWRRINRLTTRISNLQNQINDRNRNACESRPCRNGGTCLNLATGYHCLCPANWEGADCDVDVNECRNFAGSDLGCQNGAVCLNLPGSYQCLCKPNWFGVHCTRKLKDCSGGDYEMCGHGHCIPTNTGDGITCICDQGWTTNGTATTCMTDINECDTSLGPRCSVNPKVNCINLPGSFRCGQCPPGYEGDGYICSDIDECLSIPNGGCSIHPMVTCHNTIGSRICGSCPAGYQGDGVSCSWRGSCNINHGGCHPSAHCVENQALGGQMSQCICPDGMAGDGVGFEGCYVASSNTTGYCENNPCGLHGQCHRIRNGYTCICSRGYGGAHCNDLVNSCASSPCHNGGTCRLDDFSLTGFRCECTARYTGDLCQIMSRTCGGVLDSQEGSIIYPLTNTTYNHNARCAWMINIDSDKVINVTFTKFNIEKSPDCLYDFLQIHDGGNSASNLIGRYCGSEYPNGGNIISSHNKLYFWFRSDQTVAKEGFALHWTSINPVCGGEINASSNGHISSPGSPGKYPPNRDCYWHVYTTMGKRIQVHFFELDIEVHTNCSYDYLAIYDGEHTTDPLLNKYCNSTQPAPLQSASSELLIHFHSDSFGLGKGFQIVFASIDGIPGCGGYFTADRGEIDSPKYDGKYLPNLLCEYQIKTSRDTKIKIEFKSFKLERSFRCRSDYLKIYDGPSADARFVGKFCGITFPKTFISSSNYLFMKFKTDSSLVSDGFQILYSTVCQQELVGDSGLIISPGYPFSYPENRICEYIVTATPGKAVQLTFQDFDIEDNTHYNCRYDYVEVRDGPDVNSTLLGRYCGGSEHIPPVLTSTHNYLYIKFNSDMSVSGTGFYANYTTIDTECGGIYRNNTGLISYPTDEDDNYKNGQSCIWLLLAPPGTHIKLTWNRFDIEETTDCNYDYLKLIEFDENNVNDTLGIFCGVELPPALTTTTNRLMLKFVSDESIRSVGFSVSYSFLDEKTHCGGIFLKSHGFIYSPGWPGRYENDRDCSWTIKVPVGQQVALNITQFDLERPIGNRCNLGDYLDIRNGASEAAALIGRYCGNFQSKRIVSMGNVLYLHFHSDFYITGNGFKIEWDGSVTGCGGTLTSSHGSLSSPNYPENYNENAECLYKIVTSLGSKIRIEFVDLDLERTLDCKDDHIEIFDGRDDSATSLGRYCFMSSKVKSIETSTNYVFIKFRSDFYINGKGFLLNYNTVCQNNLTGNYGIIESPDYPNSYSPSLNCLWNIGVPKGNKLNITFTHFDIFQSSRFYTSPRLSFDGLNDRFSSHPWQSSVRHSWISTCSLDYLQIKQKDKQLTDKLCGNILPSPITNSDSLQIKFVTSSMIPRTGFRLEWVRYGCGGHIQKQFGMVSLPRRLDSDQEVDCEWLIETPVGTSISIIFTNVYMSQSKNCTTDAIEVYNGQSTSSPMITKICHQGTAAAQSTSHLMLVRFIKKSTLRDVYFQSQFSSQKSSCGGRIESLSGTVYSKNYPKNYENNLDCIWWIVVPNNHRIELNITDIDLYEYEDETCGDVIKIFEGVNILSSNYSHMICPESKNLQILSRNNMLTVQFTTDGYGTAKGFKANFTVTCGAIIKSIVDGIISNDKFISHITKNCTWTIVATKLTQKISLTITHMSVPRNSSTVTNRHCPSSFIRVYDGDDENAPLIDEYCGRKAPPMIVSHGSALTLQLGTYANIINGKFSAHYTSIDAACGGSLMSEEGTIASPNYPLSYPVNVDCEWILLTSPGNRVYVAFEQFDLDYSENCNEDYIEIRENNGAGNLLGVYCGNNIPINSTTGTKLYIKFHSDNKDGGLGFLLHYGFLHGNDITGLSSGDIASPLYPSPYDGPGEYTWRIITSGSEPISISIVKSEIQVHGPICVSSLSIFDGYDETAPRLEEICGIWTDYTKIIKTTSGVAFIKLKLDESNPGSLFHLTWAKENEIIEEPDDIGKINCGNNKTELLSPGQSFVIYSPNYPEYYDNDLYCEWIFKSTPGHHLSLSFQDIKLEETAGCFADYITIHSSDTGTQWKSVVDHMCLSEVKSNLYNATNFIKVIMKTDSSIVKKGFAGTVKSECGGFISDLTGIISPTWMDVINIRKKKICNWTVKVRPGRTIILNFEHFNITDQNNNCLNFVTLRNGDSIEAPMLGNGKFCGKSYEKRDNIETSSNSLYISYSYNTLGMPLTFQNFRLRYEEKNFECGATSKLDLNHKWEIINSPNYPAVPQPYTECEWIFTGPPGEVLRIDFIDRFDLQNEKECSDEFVEIRDGSSNMSPLKGRFCKERPGTIKTTGSVLYIKYVTQLAEPRDGFKANVSINMCGGTIVASSGEVSSPGYPHMQIFPVGTVCEWRIIGMPGHILYISAIDINLPESESNCGTQITISDIIQVNKTENIIQRFCNDDSDEDTTSVAETSTNEVIIKLYIGEKTKWSSTFDYKGFLFRYNSSIPVCGGKITSSEGYLTTPGYPRDTTLRYCQWLITVPNTKRRVSLELTDAGDSGHRIGIYNDLTFHSVIQSILNQGNTPDIRVFESSSNTMAIYLWLLPSATKHRFKARFTSENPALCGGSLTGRSGELLSPLLARSYVCEWDYNYSQDFITNGSSFNTLFVTANINSTINTSYCRYSDPKLQIKSDISDNIKFEQNLCAQSEISYRIPSQAMKITATQSKNQVLGFRLQWKLQHCGGVIHVGEQFNNVINIPRDTNNSIDCAWAVLAPYGSRIELKLLGSFQFECSEEFLKIARSFTDSSGLIGDYCKDKTQSNSIIAPFRFTYVQYHSKYNKNLNISLLLRTVSHQCGGYIDKYNTIFASPNYPKSYAPNLECTWEIKADLGNRISLQFLERFFVEDKPNCTKDAVIIYDWKDDKYEEMARVCGRNLPTSYNSTWNRMKVVLRTDGDGNADGFKANWVPVCGGKYTATENEQFLYSPGYPDQYDSGLDCSYEINGQNHRVFLKFLDFELEGNEPDCEYDNVTLTAYNEYDYLSSTHCGSELPPSVQSFDQVTVFFKTDNYLQRRGFKLLYTVNSCGGKITDPTAITSGLGDTYEHFMNCTWQIEGPANKIVILHIFNIDLEMSSECYADSLAIYDGLTPNPNKRLALMCGHVNSTTVLRSTNNTMLLNFVTDGSVSYSGFKAHVFFSYSESVGCGGKIDLSTKQTYNLKSPLIGNNAVYENYLDCNWIITSASDYVIKIDFLSFHIAPCYNVNQTALGYSNCDCDYVQLQDGNNPSSFVIGAYCGHTLPPTLTSSSNTLSLRLHTDGEIPSLGFEARLTTQRSVCGQTVYRIGTNLQKIRSPGYESGSIPRGLYCSYHFESDFNIYSDIHIKINNLDLQPAEAEKNQCINDKLVITSKPIMHNVSIGKDFVLNKGFDDFFRHSFFYDTDSSFKMPQKFEFCGVKKSLDFYVTDSFTVNVQTSAQSDSSNHKGFEIEVVYAGFCGRNYTDPQGRIQSSNFYSREQENSVNDCYTLITAPDNFTISAYFMLFVGSYSEENSFLDIYDGDKLTNQRIIRLSTEDSTDLAVFSTGKYLLLHNHFDSDSDQITFDLNYITSDKGCGCGGTLINEVGMVTSPRYPEVYRQPSRCEWELETPAGTRLFLRFSVFDFGRLCEQNYVSLVDRSGTVLVTYCSEDPADYTSDDNYLKIVLVTTHNNGGTGFVAHFMGIV